MKKIFIGSFLFLCLTCAGCSAAVPGAPAPKLDKSFSAQAEISFDGESCKAQLRRFDADSWELCVTEPYALEGLVVSLKDGETKLSMYGLEGEADCSESTISAARLIADAMDSAAQGNCTESGGVLTVTGESEHSLYSLTLDESGNPAELKLSGRNVSVSLSDFKELPVSEQTEETEFDFTVE